jgi:indolepyruvate ferredoxin oxidoreductase
VSALLGMAAHIEGKASATADMAGLAQKGGAVYSHVRLGENNDALRSPRIITGGADLLFACDAVTGAGPVTQDLLNPKRTAAVVNANIAPVSDFVRNRDLDFKTAQVEKAIRNSTNANATDFIQADRVATAIMGDAIAANMMMLGYAWQKGLVPLKLESILAAIKLNAVAIAFNKKAFSLGRLLAHDPRKVEAMVEAARGPMPEAPATALEDIIAKRVADLTLYQDAAYAARYETSVRAILSTEQKVMAGSERLALSVAKYLYKLMAIKDEYEVARLYTDGRFEKALHAQFDGDFKRKVWLSPPLISKIDPNSGRPEKKPFGPWIFTAFRMLASLKKWRGTKLDLLGRTAERKMERQLLADYHQLLDQFVSGLTAENHGLAVQLASLPDQIRGFGPVKEASVHSVAKERDRLMAHWPAGHAHKLAAE